jgi:hypothetical protein
MPVIDQMDPLAPTRAVNHAAQTIETVACWGVAILVVVWAYRMSRRRGNWLPLAIPLAAAINSFNEPLFDRGYHLFWYKPGQWTLFSTFGFPQPVWVMSAYMIVYATPCLFVMQQIERGKSREWVYKFFAVASLAVATWESLAIYAGTYTYYGDHPFRAGKYPVWLGVMEGAHIIVWAILVAALTPVLVKGARVLLAVPLFGISFCSVMFAAGTPGLAVVNADPMPTWGLYAGATASMALACVVVWLAAQLLPSERGAGRDVASLLRSIADKLAPAFLAGPPPASQSVTPARTREPISPI